MQRFVRKLRNGANLTTEDEAALYALAGASRTVPARSDIVVEGDQPRSIVLVQTGWVCSYRQLENGRRQIINFLVPGDLSEPFGILPDFADHSLAALTPVSLMQVSPDALRSLAEGNPRIGKALWWNLLVDMAIERERIVSLGRRSASERLGHLICELHQRLEMVGLANGLQYEMPLTQADIADALGLSTVHVNRSLQDLRSRGAVSLRGRKLTIQDPTGLRAASFFDATYLHADEVGSSPGPGSAEAYASGRALR